MVLAAFVVAITALLLIPLPTALLDVVLVLNLSFSFILLLTALYIPNALSLLAFPSLILLTTLFRLSLDVACTRLILSQGDAGAVIRTFGTLLIGSELIVGVIIFTIITIVNFIVIAKGSSRVSEVAARFALDALPGKQMAIDADLRGGLISPEQAQGKREDLRKESQLYGAMDGAMKFIQGDAIAGIMIILTNIFGGLYLGIVNSGLSFSEALHTYTVLTVGEGLVHQIPALLISICAGIVVTRVSSGENTTLGSDLGTQLFARPGILYFAGGLILALGLFTGLPKVPFLLVGIGILVMAFRLALSGTPASGSLLPARSEFQGVFPNSRPSGLISATPAEEENGDEPGLVFALDAAVLFRLYKMNPTKYHVWWRELQSDFGFETGLRLPTLSVSADDTLPPSSYSILVDGSAVETGTMLLDSVLVEVSPDQAVCLGLEVGEEAVHPVDGSRVFWAAQSPGLRRVVEASGIRTFDFVEYLGLKAARFYVEHPEELLGVVEVHSLLKQVEKKHPGFLTDAFGPGGINLPRLTKIVQELLRAEVSVRDFRQIIEGVASYCSTERVELNGDEAVDVGAIVNSVRLGRKRQLITRALSPRRTLKVLTLSPEVEDIFEEAELLPNGIPALPPESIAKMKEEILRLIEPVQVRGLLPVALLCRGSARQKVSALTRLFGSTVKVIAMDELEPKLVLEPLGMIRV